MRSIWKTPYLQLYKKIPKRTWNKKMVILKQFIGRKLRIYNGKRLCFN